MSETLFIASIESLEGWYKAAALILFVLVFNFLAKWTLKRLQHRYERQKRTWEESFVKALYLPLSYFVWFFALIYSVDIIGKNLNIDFTFHNMGMIISVGAVLAFVWFLLRWKNNIVQHMLLKSKNREITIDPGKIDAIDKITTLAIIFFTILTLLEVTERSVNTLIAFGGVGGLSLAFASQEIISNFFGGLMIYLTHPFTIGDWILLPEKNIEGYVEEIGWYMTRVRSLDKRPIYIPNSIFTKLVVVTPSRMSHRQIKETISLRPSDRTNIKSIVDDIKDMLQQNPDIDRNLPIQVNFSAFGNASLDITLNVFTTTIDSSGYANVKEKILYKIYNILHTHNAEIATHYTPTYQISIHDQKSTQ